MTTWPRPKLRNGWPQSLAALAVVAVAAGVVAASSWGESQTAGRLAIGGVVFFAAVLIAGSGRLVALASLPILVAALLTFIGNGDLAWIRGVVVGVLCYVATELAWDAIERRDEIRRTAGYNVRRIDEIVTVVTLSLAVSGTAFMFSGVAPVRTVFVLTVATSGVVFGLVLARRGLRRSGAEEPIPKPNS